MKVRAKFAAALLVAGMLLAAGCGGGSGGSGGGSDKLTLVAYSTPREAYEALIPEFQRTEAGKGVGFSQSYGASGDQQCGGELGANLHRSSDPDYHFLYLVDGE